MRKQVLISIYLVLILLSCFPAHSITVKGIAFEDKNANRILDEKEKGLREVFLSDGDKVVSTDKEGKFIFDTDKKFIYIIKPQNYKITTDWYYDLKEKKAIKFGLMHESEPKNFSFVQFTDSHLGGESGKIHSEDLSKTIKEINEQLESFPLKPEFVIATGDLVDHADEINAFITYKDIVSALKLPHYVVIGNHDVHGLPRLELKPVGKGRFMDAFGPLNYGFLYGNVFFIVLDGNLVLDKPYGLQYRIDEAQLKWIDKLLSTCAKDKNIVCAIHQDIPGGVVNSKKLVKVLKKYHAKMIIHGHYGCGETKYENIDIIGCPSVGRGYYIYCVENNKITPCRVPLGMKLHILKFDNISLYVYDKIGKLNKVMMSEFAFPGVDFVVKKGGAHLPLNWEGVEIGNNEIKWGFKSGKDIEGTLSAKFNKNEILFSASVKSKNIVEDMFFFFQAEPFVYEEYQGTSYSIDEIEGILPKEPVETVCAYIAKSLKLSSRSGKVVSFQRGDKGYIQIADAGHWGGNLYVIRFQNKPKEEKLELKISVK